MYIPLPDTKPLFGQDMLSNIGISCLFAMFFDG